MKAIGRSRSGPFGSLGTGIVKKEDRAPASFGFNAAPAVSLKRDIRRGKRLVHLPAEMIILRSLSAARDDSAGRNDNTLFSPGLTSGKQGKPRGQSAREKNTARNSVFSALFRQASFPGGPDSGPLSQRCKCTAGLSAGQSSAVFHNASSGGSASLAVGTAAERFITVQPTRGNLSFPYIRFYHFAQKDKTDTINNFPVYKTKNYFLFNPI